MKEESSKTFYRMASMVIAHEAQTGNEPACIQAPTPKEGEEAFEYVRGVRVFYWKENKWFTASEGQIIHHQFLGEE